MKHRPGNYQTLAFIACLLFALTGCLGSNTGANLPPVANAGAIQNVMTGTRVTLDGSASFDVNSDPLTYSWALASAPAGSAAALANESSVAPAFTADKDGVYVARLIVNDGKVDSDAASVTITASAATANAAPVANAGAAQSVVTGATVTLDGSASSDANGDPLTYRWTQVYKPSASTAALKGADTPSPTFTADADGGYVFALVVNDGKADSVVATVTVTAATSNTAPVANAGAAQNVIAGATVTLDGSASSDANGDTLTYRWTLTSKPAGSAAALSGTSSVVPTLATDLAGTYVATLIVNDGKVDSAAVNVTITAATANAAPVANAGTVQNVVTGTSVTLNGSASTDANGDPLTYRWTLVYKPVGSTAALNSATTVSPSFTADMDGGYVFALVVNDGKADSAVANVTITAATGNVAPVANAGAAQNVSTGGTVTLNGSASSDANGNALTYQWSQIYKPVGSSAALSSTTTPTPTFTADVDGGYVFALIVNDGKVNSAAATVTVTAATANSAPVANAGAGQNVIAGTTVTLNGSASSDANNDPLTYRWTLTSKPAGSAAALSSTSSAAPTIATDLAGTYVATLIVNDGKVDSAAATVTITAATANSAPVANAGAAQNVSTGATVTLNGGASSDANGDPLTYAWTLVYKPAGSTVALSSTTAIAPTFTPDVAGAYVATLVVNDGKVNSSAATVVVTAVAIDTFPPGTTAAPSVSGTTDTATTLGVTIHENGTGYYLVRFATAPVPTVAEVQAGSSFAMTANVPATTTISGLTFNTPYVIYFVAKDAANNVQTFVQSVAVTTLPTTTMGYVFQGGLTWMPVTFVDTWVNANAYCTNTVINGASGWRMPTQAELSGLHASGAMIGLGWRRDNTWSSLPYSPGVYYIFNLLFGSSSFAPDSSSNFVSCVR